MKGDLKRTSKFLSLVLRHKPEVIGLSLDGEGWAGVDTPLLRAISPNLAKCLRELLGTVR